MALAKINAENLVDYITAWEGGNMTRREYLNLFSYLIKTQQAWSLQGMYGREAYALIKNGIMTDKGRINMQRAKEAWGDLNKNIYDE